MFRSVVTRQVACVFFAGMALLPCASQASEEPEPLEGDAATEFAAEVTSSSAPAQIIKTDHAAPAVTVPATPATTALVDLLRLAARDNPMVRAAHHRYLAATHKRAQAVALADPRAEITYFVRQADMKYMLALTQEVPWPGKLVIQGKVAGKEAEAARLRYEAALRDSLSDVKEIYFELYYIDRAQGVTEEIRKLYDRSAALAAGGSELAAPKLPETFRAESQRAQLSYDLVLLKEMRAAEVERLRAATGAALAIEFPITEDVADPLELAETLESLQEVAQTRNQELLAAGVETQRAQYQAKLARRGPIPDLLIGARFERREPLMNDAVGITAGITLPLWIPKYRAMAKEAQENELAAKAEFDAQGLRVRSDLARAYFSLNNSFRLVRLYRDTLLPQARQALNSAEALYRNKQASLASVLETTASVHNFELARLRATADFYASVARLERVLGTALKLKGVE